MQNLFKLISPAVFLTVLFLVSTVQAKTIERIAAVAGDEIITLNDVRTEGVLRYAVKGKDLKDIQYADNPDEELDELVRELIQTRLIARRARKNNINIGDREVDMQLQEMYRKSGQSEDVFKSMMASEGIEWKAYRAYIRSELETQFVMRSELAGQVQPSETDAVACAQEKVPDAKNSITVTLRQITIHDVEADSAAGLAAPAAKTLNAVWWNSIDTAVKQYAHGVQKIAAAHPEKFEEYVKKYSSGRSAERGGVLGSFSPGDLSKDFAPVFTLKKGEVSTLISTANGYHIMRADDIVEGESEAWKKAVEQCREMIVMKETQRLISSWLNDLMEKSYVSILVNKDISKNKF